MIHRGVDLIVSRTCRRGAAKPILVRPPSADHRNGRVHVRIIPGNSQEVKKRTRTKTFANDRIVNARGRTQVVSSRRRTAAKAGEEAFQSTDRQYGSAESVIIHLIPARGLERYPPKAWSDCCTRPSCRRQQDRRCGGGPSQSAGLGGTAPECAGSSAGRSPCIA